MTPASQAIGKEFRMTKIGKFRTVAAAALAALAGAAGEARAAQCGNSAAGFEGWKRQFAEEARSRVSASAISALMGTQYASATIAADRGQRSFRLSLDQFLAKRGGSAIVSRARAQAVERRAVRADRAALRRAARAAARDLGHGDR